MTVVEGVRVLEACEGTAGEFAGLLLAELGADVAKLECGRVDRPSFRVLNRSKSSVAIGEDRDTADLVTELLHEADVVICDLTDNRRAEFGVNTERIHAVNPGAIVADVTAYGRHGRLGRLSGHSQIAAAMSGAVGSQWSTRGGGTWVVSDIGAHMAGMQTATGVLAALVGQGRDGIGREVSTSLIGGWMGLRAVHAVAGEQVRQVSVSDPQGGLSPLMRLYQTGDGGWLMLSCSTPEFWVKLCVALDMTEVACDPRFEHAPLGVPNEHKPALVALVAERLATDTRDVWLACLRANDVPCAPVQSPEEALHDAQLEFNGGVVEVVDPGLGAMKQVAFPIRMDGCSFAVKNPAPDLGADNGRVRARWSSARRSERTEPRRGVVDRPLSGVKVLEICDWVIGPYAGAILRQLGAEVWKVESLRGDDASQLSFVYLPINSGKQVIRVDLARPDGQEVLRDLIRAADVVMHNHRPKGAARLGFDADAVHRVNPTAVYHEMVSFGRGGPLAGDPAFDHLVAARAGLSWRQGGTSAGNPPVLHNGSSGDLPGGVVAAMAVCAGLLRRAARGTGTSSWSALFESGYLVNFAENISYDGRSAQAEGGVDYLGPTALRRLYRSSDGWLLLAVDDEASWTAATALFGLDEASPFSTVADAPPDGDLADGIAARLEARAGIDWEAAALAAHVPLVVPRVDQDAIVDEHNWANGYQSHGRDPELGDFYFPAYLVQVGERPEESTLSPPDPTAGAAEILRSVGYSSERITELEDRGVIGTPRLR